ncbi:MAG: ThuA domain-containing protein [Bacteroidota bacterium]
MRLGSPHSFQYLRTLILLGFVLLMYACSTPNSSPSKRILVFSKTKAYRHASIETGVTALKELGSKKGYEIVHTEDENDFVEEYLKKFAAIVFLNTTGDVLNASQQVDLQRYIQAGGGFAGIHAAADTEYEWPWYGELVGGYFESHPPVQEANISVVSNNHSSTSHLSDSWARKDEWYNFTKLSDNITVLLNLDESSYEGGKHGKNHPIAWYQEFDGGKSFYTGGGHTIEAFQEQSFLDHIWGGISYATSKGALDYSKTELIRIPPENRFKKTVLDDNLYEPTELVVMEDGKVLFTQRRGEVLLFDPEKDKTEQIHTFDVWHEEEDGLMGVGIPPDFEASRWMYFYYSPNEGKSVNRLSRFQFNNDQLELESEQVLLEVDVQRETCCHTGGSIEFDDKGLLYLSTGDNTNPFASNGYGPIDERRGRSSWDAQGSSGNMNDLRGAILRIKPEDDGTYSIPEGNLFPPGTPNTRPELFVKGCRNPYRIAVDSHTGYVYWGDVGPDAGKNSESRGPRGHDEVNQARKAGYFGWPYFVANNKPYNDYNFATKTSGNTFDPAQPKNLSPNNTGVQDLPPAQPAFIYYPYAKSEEFPLMGTGGRNAMAGLVYYMSDFEGKENRLPAYYDKKLLTYDWIRSRFFWVSMNEEGDFVEMEEFLESMDFSKPIDIVMAKNGSLYVLEYGAYWFKQNRDAKLVKIDYLPGNRPPLPKITASSIEGKAPLTVDLSAEESEDFDRDELSFEWQIDGLRKNLKGENTSHTFEQPGTYTVRLTVTDKNGESSIAKQKIIVGNDPPQIAWKMVGNKTFFWEDRKLYYQVEVSDTEDGVPGNGITENDVDVTIDYLAEGYDRTEISQEGHQAAPVEISEFEDGKQLIAGSDCASCHAINEQVNGPSYLEIANRYAGEEGIVKTLAMKIQNGGSGNWGETVMSAHPQINDTQAGKIVEYILSLGSKGKKKNDLPMIGDYVFQESEENTDGSYVMLASYEDNGSGFIKPFVKQDLIVLRPTRIDADHFDEVHPKADASGGKLKGYRLRHNYFVGLKDIDLTQISGVTVLGAPNGLAPGTQISLCLDHPFGEQLGSLTLGEEKTYEFYIPIKQISETRDVYVRVHNNAYKDAKNLMLLGGMEFIVQKDYFSLK